MSVPDLTAAEACSHPLTRQRRDIFTSGDRRSERITCTACGRTSHTAVPDLAAALRESLERAKREREARDAVPDLAAVEAYHAAVIAGIDRTAINGMYGTNTHVLLRALADQALDGLRRHSLLPDERGSCAACLTAWVDCPDSLAWWSVLTGIGTTYGVTP